MKGLFIIALLCSTALFAQENDTTAVRHTINQLFDGMRKADSALVHDAFLGSPSMVTTFTNKEGESVIHAGELQAFLDAVGKPKEELWDERISDVVIQIDDNLASAWMNYSFYVDDKFSHCGVNCIQLFKDKSGWKIIGISDTRRRSKCNE